MSAGEHRHVVIVGGGFAGLGCAQRLAEHDDVRRHADRPQQLPPVPAAALPGGDLAAGAQRHRALTAIGVRRPEERRRQARRDLRGRPRRENRDVDRRRAMGCGRARARGRLAAELLRHAGRRGELVPAVLARRRHAAAVADPRHLRAGRPRPEADRARRAELRDRRRRADRRRGGGRDRRHDRRSRCRRHTRTSTPAPAQIHLLDYGDALLKPFSDEAHGYVAKVLEEKGVKIHLGTGVKEVGTGHALLSDGTHDRHSVRDLGRRHQGRGRRRRRGPRPGARGPRRRRGRPDAGRPRRRVRDRGHRQHSRGRSRRAAAAWIGRAADPATGRPTTSSPTSRASPASRSSTTTRASWR